MIEKHITLRTYINDLQKAGKLFVIKKNALADIGGAPKNLDLAFSRLVSERRLYRLRRGFYGITPLEYQDRGCAPPDWFIDQMMTYGSEKYYVGLLSAAALHGAAHQQPMQFQVVTSDLKLRNWNNLRTRIVFYKKKHFPAIGASKVKTVTGYMWVSDPELTAFDLVRYPSASGHFNNIAMVLSELGEKINSKKLLTIAKNTFSERGELVYWQRLCYVLDRCGYSAATKELANLIMEINPPYKYLVSSAPKVKLEKSTKWNLYINQNMEFDL